MRVPALLAVSLCGLAVAGCRSAGKGQAPQFAAVEIEGNTPGQIRDVATEVFRSHGFRVAQAGLARMVFEKEGTGMDNAAYGDWMGGKVWIRVKASIIAVSDRNFRLECNAYTVQDKGVAGLEQEIKLSKFRRGRYQKLLDEVASRL